MYHSCNYGLNGAELNKAETALLEAVLYKVEIVVGNIGITCDYGIKVFKRSFRIELVLKMSFSYNSSEVFCYKLSVCSVGLIEVYVYFRNSFGLGLLRILH